VHRSAIVLREKGVPFDVRYIDLAAKPDWFRRLSPRGKVPLLEVDGAPIFESAAINEFVDETHPPHLLPATPLERARHRAWVEVANDLFAAQYKLVTATTKAEYEAAKSQAEAILDRFGDALEGDFFGGERFGLVDAAAAPALHRFVILERRSGLDLLRAGSKAAAWAHRIAERSSVIEGVPADFEPRYLAYVEKGSGYLAREILGRQAPHASGHDAVH
jgi:glutathione S-transferase